MDKGNKMKQKMINIVKALGLLALVFATNLPPMLFLQTQKEMSLGISWVSAIFYVILATGVLLFLWRYYRRLHPQKLSIKWSDFGFAIVWFIAARAIAIFGTLLIQQVSGQATSANDAALLELGKLMKGGFLPFAILYILVITLVAPIVEELIFRGLWTEILFNGKIGWPAWLVTTSAFALLHTTTILEFLLYFAIGSILFVAYDRRGEIKDSILVHILNNLLAGIYMATLLF